MLVAIYERAIQEFRPTALVRWERQITTSYGSDPSDYDGAIQLLMSGRHLTVAAAHLSRERGGLRWLVARMAHTQSGRVSDACVCVSGKCTLMDFRSRFYNSYCAAS